MNTFSTRRSGGQSALNSARTAPLTKHLCPVSDSMSAGTFLLLDDAEMSRIHAEVLHTLETNDLLKALGNGMVFMNRYRSNAGQ